MEDLLVYKEFELGGIIWNNHNQEVVNRFFDRLNKQFFSQVPQLLLGSEPWTSADKAVPNRHIQHWEKLGEIHWISYFV